ncbi:hypothetical protein RHECNPAF_2190027 [Rhizobium etli CNPAF512]|nr:hypothetical protein RHECNPAF_2190027 [Rhizobium etli CNPAF512]
MKSIKMSLKKELFHLRSVRPLSPQQFLQPDGSNNDDLDNRWVRLHWPPCC